MSSVVKVNI